MEHTPAPYGPRSVYGYALYIGSNMLFFLFLIWAVVPDHVLHNLGLTYWPSKYWAVAIPIWALTALATFAFIIYPAINLTMTPDIDDITTIMDEHSTTKKETVPGGIPPVYDIPITEDCIATLNRLSISPIAQSDNKKHMVSRIGKNTYLHAVSLNYYLLKNIMRRIIIKNKVNEKCIDNDECDTVANDFRHTIPLCDVVDLRKQLKNVIDTNTIFFSFELTRVKDINFYQSFVTEMDKYRPLFYALTSRMKNKIKHVSSLDIFKALPHNTLLHLVANDLTRTDVKIILTKALHCGIINIFVLRGDSTTTSSDFHYAVDLVRFIKFQFGDIFCICVTGYPDMHPESTSKEVDLFYLKEKVDAGADFIITQFFFEASVFIQFVNDCKNAGISVPIIPGILSISSYEHLQRMVKICNVKVPQAVLDILQHVKDKDDDVSSYGLELSINIIKDIIASKITCGFHLFTFNKSSLPSKICKRLSAFDEQSDDTKVNCD